MAFGSSLFCCFEREEKEFFWVFFPKNNGGPGRKIFQNPGVDVFWGGLIFIFLNFILTQTKNFSYFFALPPTRRELFIWKNFKKLFSEGGAGHWRGGGGLLIEIFLKPIILIFCRFSCLLLITPIFTLYSPCLSIRI